MKIAVLWSRYGPYHLARLKGAQAAARTRGDEVLGFEMWGDDGVYDWEPVDGERPGVTTIFPDCRHRNLCLPTVRRRMTHALEHARCSIAAVNGWSAPEARAALAWCRANPSRRAVLMSETKRDDSRRYWWKEWLKRRIVKRCDTALVGGRAQVDYLRELGLERNRIFTGYDAVDNAYFKSGAEAARRNAAGMRRRYQLPEDYFLACTRFLPRKNVDGLLRAYQRYRHRCEGRPWGLVILGSGAEGDRLRRLERRMGDDGVLWPGFVQYDALPAYYGLASAFIHPARSEAWGLVVNEAAASGLPLLVSRTVGARYELVDDGANGYLFDPTDIDGMAASMVQLSQMHEQERRRMGERSEEIVTDWSPRNFGEQLILAADLAASLPDR